MLVGVAGGEHQSGETLGVVRHDELADRAAGVVSDEHHVAQVELLHDAGDHPRDAARGNVGVRSS